MVFGWGKKKNEPKKEEPIVQTREIKLDEVLPILKEMQDLRKKTIISETRAFQENMMPQLSELVKIANTLEKDNLKVDDIDKHLKIMVLRGKKQVISTIKNEATRKTFDVNSYDDVVRFNANIVQMLKKIGDALGRQSRVIHLFAKKYADRLKIILSTLNDNKDELLRITKNYEQFENDVSEISSLIDSIENSENKIYDKQKRIEELSTLLEDSSSKISQAKQNLENIKSSQEYLEYVKNQEQITNLLPEQNRIKHEIDDQFTKISRPLSKYVYVSSLDKEQKSLLEKLVENPFSAMYGDTKNDIIVILQSVRKGVQAGSVSVKDVDKSISYLDETTELLDGFIKKVSTFLEKRNEFEKQLQRFDMSKLHSAESKIEKHQRNKNDFESRLDELKSEIDEIKNSKPEAISKIELLLRSASSTQYKVIS